MKRRSWNIHERFLRHIWSKQYLTTHLQTADGRSLKILDTGKLNTGSGPDFLDAKARIGAVTYSGDIEIHRTIYDWFHHRHQNDPRYNKVILHVVLEPGGEIIPVPSQCGRIIPLLVLGWFLSESIHAVWQKAILDERLIRNETIRCESKNHSLSPEQIDRGLKKMAVERMELKLRRFEERLRQLAQERRMSVQERMREYGELPMEGRSDEIPMFPEISHREYSQKEFWEQILYEGIMEGLGYSKNREPFSRLARAVSLAVVKDAVNGMNETALLALLFGTAGLLPKVHGLKEQESRAYVRQLQYEWKKIKPKIHSEILHSADWQFFPARPANFPTLRISAAGVLIQKILFEDLFRCIIQTMKKPLSAKEKIQAISSLLRVETTGFWSRHFHFDDPGQKKRTGLGSARIQEICVNTLVPISLLYARIFHDAAIREGVMQIYTSLPASPENSITRLMERQLLKGRSSACTAACQQAAIQLYKYYCMEHRCADCDFGTILFASE